MSLGLLPASSILWERQRPGWLRRGRRDRRAAWVRRHCRLRQGQGDCGISGRAEETGGPSDMEETEGPGRMEDTGGPGGLAVAARWGRSCRWPRLLNIASLGV